MAIYPTITVLYHNSGNFLTAPRSITMVKVTMSNFSNVTPLSRTYTSQSV